MLVLKLHFASEVAEFVASTDVLIVLTCVPTVLKTLACRLSLLLV